MKIEHYTKTAAEAVEGSPGVTIRWVVSQDDDAPNFAMRVIEIQPGSNSPYHIHDYEHEIFVLSGAGFARDVDGNETPIEPGTVLYIAPNEKHGLFNRGDEVLRIVCLVPHT